MSSTTDPQAESGATDTSNTATISNDTTSNDTTNPTKITTSNDTTNTTSNDHENDNKNDNNNNEKSNNTNHAPTNQFQTAIAAWRSLDLTTLVTHLDSTAAALVTQQKDSLVQRKDLAAKTKDFRKLDDAAKLGEMKDLLKMYQAYIDLLTHHGKSVQAAFMQAYSPLSEAPDPYPLLEASVDGLVAAEEVVPRLEGENGRLHQQNSTLTRQLEEAERQLETERQARQESEAARERRKDEVEASWAAVLREKEENWTAKERSWEEKAEGQERLLKELKASYEVAQRLERAGDDAHASAQDPAGRGTSATQAELDLLTTELDRSNTRLADLEHRNESLRLELAQSATHAPTSAHPPSVEDDPAYLRLRSENQSLLRKLDSARDDKERERGSIDARLRSLDRDAGALKAERDALQARVQKWSDYDEVKRELDMLRAIEFSTAEDDGDDDPDKHDEPPDDDDASSTIPPANGGSRSRSGESLERLLLARNKKLSNDLTALRVAHNDLQARLAQLAEDLATANGEVEQTRKLNATLENDLQKTQEQAAAAAAGGGGGGAGGVPWENMSVAGTWTSRVPGKSAYGSLRRGGGGNSPTSSLIGGSGGGGGGGGSTLDALHRSGESTPGGGGGGAGAGPAAQGILPMVTAQRDRFKQKLGALDAELHQQYATVSSLRAEIASLQRDNLALYEKTRYVSTYNHPRRPTPTTLSSPSGAGASGADDLATSSLPRSSSSTSSGDPSLSRYATAYEASLSPFAAFRSRETTRALRRLSLPERAVWQLLRLVSATRRARGLFGLYWLGLHVLVLGWVWFGVGGCAGGVGGVGEVGGVGTGGGGGGVGAGGGAAAGGQWRQEGFGGG